MVQRKITGNQGNNETSKRNETTGSINCNRETVLRITSRRVNGRLVRTKEQWVAALPEADMTPIKEEETTTTIKTETTTPPPSSSAQPGWREKLHQDQIKWERELDERFPSPGPPPPRRQRIGRYPTARYAPYPAAEEPTTMRTEEQVRSDKKEALIRWRRRHWLDNRQVDNVETPFDN